ncbi:unnamed protein product [Brugia timori]|uniref:AT-hook motif nuclear-localized protein n=1 Tax=Brugia timori TaxID=42155 RepID=A0A0R3QRY5_9BILA|nr:unnamed protein product [Brugia timori]
MTSTIGGRMNVTGNDVKLGRNGDQIVINEKQSSRKRSNAKRGGVKRRMSLAYQQQQYMLMRGGHPGGRPLHPVGTNAARMMSSRYPNASGPPHHFPPQKFGFFNEATPSIHPGHPGSEVKRIYEGPPKPRLMLEEQGRTRQKSVPKPPKFLFTSGRGDIELDGRPYIGSTLEVGSYRSAVPNEQQGGMNELFVSTVLLSAKMIWKKLDMIQSPMRLNRLHTEIMNLLQQAIAEETGK